MDQALKNFITHADERMIKYYGVNNTMLMFMHHVMCVSGNGLELSEDGSEIIYFNHETNQYVSMMSDIDFDRFNALKTAVIEKIKSRILPRNNDSSISKLLAAINHNGDMVNAIMDEINSELNEFKTHCYGKQPTIENFTVEHFKECIKSINKEYQAYYKKVWVPYPGSSLGMHMTVNTPKWLVQFTHNMCVAILETRKSPSYFVRNKKKYMQGDHIEYSYKAIQKLKEHCEKLGLSNE